VGERGIIWGCYIAGKSEAWISAHLELPKSTINSTITKIRYNQENGVEDIFESKSRSGRPPLLDEQAQQYLVRALK
jgi:transposase